MTLPHGAREVARIERLVREARLLVQIARVNDQLNLARVVLQRREGQVLAERSEHAQAARDAGRLAFELVELRVDLVRQMGARERRRKRPRATRLERLPVFRGAQRRCGRRRGRANGVSTTPLTLTS